MEILQMRVLSCLLHLFLFIFFEETPPLYLLHLLSILLLCHVESKRIKSVSLIVNKVFFNKIYNS